MVSHEDLAWDHLIRFDTNADPFDIDFDRKTIEKVVKKER